MIETMELVNNYTIKSLKDTEMEISLTSAIESKYLKLLMIDADEDLAKTEEDLAMQSKLKDQSLDTTSNVIEIRLKNALNIERKIILTYTK